MLSSVRWTYVASFIFVTFNCHNVLEKEEFLVDLKISYIMINWDMKAKVTFDTDEMFIIVSL